MVDIYRDAMRRGIYPLLFTDPEGDSCFSIYQIRWIKKNAPSISSKTFAKRRAIFLSVRKTVNIQGYSKLQEPIKTCENCSSTDLINTNDDYCGIEIIVLPNLQLHEYGTHLWNR